MNDLFPPEPEELAAIAKKRLPRVAKPTGQCAADFALFHERRDFRERVHKRSVSEMERERILAARAAIKAATPRKARKKKGVVE